MKGVCVLVCVCVCTCVHGEGRGACILKLQQYSSSYYMYMAGVDRLVYIFTLKYTTVPSSSISDLLICQLLPIDALQG